MARQRGPDAPPPPRRTRAVGTIATTVTRKVEGVETVEKATTEHPPVPEDVGDPHGYVMVKGGITRNVTNFNSVNVQVSIGMPCVATLPAAEKKYEEVSAVVDKLLTRELRLALVGDQEPQPDAV